ncbi:hypothetical protein [Ancylobacter radicis]|uniref:Helix-turn-helix domain-containing protein n=1 Tax=Ancylobacter radicis TaxID=2836179 RepID=A0ABS5R9T7_9HYPH|nr:hypothetical protein [Ancylobacter radicis]MBS9477646.1 hypothetical protein [Ancylobacter radicis]
MWRWKAWRQGPPGCRALLGDDMQMQTGGLPEGRTIRERAQSLVTAKGDDRPIENACVFDLLANAAGLSTAARSLAEAIHGSSPDRLDALAKELWVRHGAGALSDAEAEALSGLLEKRRGRKPATVAAPRGFFILKRFAPRRPQRSPDREASLRRRRCLSRSSPMPPQLAAAFTEGQCAVLAIIGGEVKHHGVCDLPIDKIAALAGVCRTSVQNALHEARRLGFIKVTYRPRRGAKSLPNMIEIVSPEWLAWLKRGPTAHKPTGSKSVARSKILNPTKSIEGEEAFNKGGRVGGFPPSGRAGMEWRTRHAHG